MEAQSAQMQVSIETMFFSVRELFRLPATVVEASSINSFKKRLADWNDVEP